MYPDCYSLASVHGWMCMYPDCYSLASVHGWMCMYMFEIVHSFLSTWGAVSLKQQQQQQQQQQNVKYSNNMQTCTDFESKVSILHFYRKLIAIMLSSTFYQCNTC